MADWIVYSIGFLAQILFSSRLLIQWITSERQRKVITPSVFWVLSLIASFLLFIYGYLRLDFAIMFGQILTYFIYIRNLQLQNKWNQLPKFMRIILFIFPGIILLYYVSRNEIDIDLLIKNEAIPFWLFVLGITSQIVFMFRFVYQWIYSEKQKESSLPMGFWVLSLIGATLILVYAILRKDPVLIVGHLFGIIIYSRNVYLIRAHYDKVY